MQQLKPTINKLNKNLKKQFNKTTKKVNRRIKKWTKLVKKSTALQSTILFALLAIVILVVALYQRHHRLGAEKEAQLRQEQIELKEQSLQNVNKQLENAETDLETLKKEKEAKDAEIEQLQQELQAKLERQEAARLAAIAKAEEDSKPTTIATTQAATSSPTPASQGSGNCSLAYNYDWPQDIAFQICQHESGGNPNAANWQDDHSSWAGCFGSFGLMQINCSNGQVYDGVQNMNIAHSMYKSWGNTFRAWTTCSKVPGCS